MVRKDIVTKEMRARIAINDQGTILASDGESVPCNGFLILRKKSGAYIHMETVPSYAAIAVLLQTLRAINTVIHFVQPDVLTEKCSISEFCIMIAQLGLQIIEDEQESPFASTMKLFHKSDVEKHQIPDKLIRLSRMELRNIAAAATLMQASKLNNPDLVVVAQNRSMRFYFVALPRICDWPALVPRTQFPIDDECDDHTARWLTLSYKTALATKLPLFQYGTIKLTADRTVKFQRILLPIAPPSERPANHRILSLTTCPIDPDITLI